MSSPPSRPRPIFGLTSPSGVRKLSLTALAWCMGSFPCVPEPQFPHLSIGADYSRTTPTSGGNVLCNVCIKLCTTQVGPQPLGKKPSLTLCPPPEGDSGPWEQSCVSWRPPFYGQSSPVLLKVAYNRLVTSVSSSKLPLLPLRGSKGLKAKATSFIFCPLPFLFIQQIHSLHSARLSYALIIGLFNLNLSLHAWQLQP